MNESMVTTDKAQRVMPQTHPCVVCLSIIPNTLFRLKCTMINLLSRDVVAVVISRCSTERFQLATFSTNKSCAVGIGSARWSNHQSNKAGRTWHHANTLQADEWYWTSQPTCPYWHLPSWIAVSRKKSAAIRNHTLQTPLFKKWQSTIAVPNGKR